MKVEIISPEIVWSPALRLKCLTNINGDLTDWSKQISNCHYPPSVLFPSDSSRKCMSHRCLIYEHKSIMINVLLILLNEDAISHINIEFIEYSKMN
jgi:hypothetical protein